MDYFNDIYKKRLNRYGTDYQSRVQGQREREFSNYLLKSLYRVEFQFEGEMYVGSLERNKQNNTQLLHFLLTETSLNIPPGTILFLQDKDMIDEPWMIYWLEEIKASGYNKYIVLKMTHFIQWVGRDKQTHSSWAYMYGQQDNMLKEELRSRSRSATLYTENLKLNFLVMPFNSKLSKDDYIEIDTEDLKEGYVVTGYDIQSSKGIMHVSVDPRFLRDHTPEPVHDPTNPDDDADDYFWLGGG